MEKSDEEEEESEAHSPRPDRGEWEETLHGNGRG